MFLPSSTQTELEGICRVPQGILHVPSNSNRVPGVYTTSTLFQQSWYTPDCRVYCIYPVPILPFYTSCHRVYCIYPAQTLPFYSWYSACCRVYCMYTVQTLSEVLDAANTLTPSPNQGSYHSEEAKLLHAFTKHYSTNFL